jgi:L-threonine kinase
MPPAGPKVAAAVDLALKTAGALETTLVVRTDNPLPRARGYASSTVDVAGAILAVGEALGRPFAPAEVARLAVAVEPSDSIMFPGLALLAHRDASFHRLLGPVPRLAVVVIDPGGAVDTVAFNRADHCSALTALASTHRAAFDLLLAGLASGDGRAVAEAGTISALAHQALLPNPLLEPALALARRAGALGVVRAHSGMLVGLVCQPEAAPSITRLAQAHFPACSVSQHRCL